MTQKCTVQQQAVQDTQNKCKMMHAKMETDARSKDCSCSLSTAPSSIEMETLVTARMQAYLACLHVVLAVSHESVNLANIVLHKLDHERHCQVGQTILPCDLHEDTKILTTLRKTDSYKSTIYNHSCKK